ncbi:MAG: DUF1353 domain-containing protein [Sedimentisphaerales bacterium]|nr:DUF1353 domain-containing protein [Sedimentisphaerales bacterium]
MKYRELHGWKYELIDTVMVQTDIVGLGEIDTEYISLWDNGQLFIKLRYAWDGASGPAFDTKTIMRGSLVHDALYQLMRDGLLDRKKYRPYADKLLREICLEDGMWKLRANWVYWAVQTFAKRNSEPEKEPRGRIVTIE